VSLGVVQHCAPTNRQQHGSLLAPQTETGSDHAVNLISVEVGKKEQNTYGIDGSRLPAIDFGSDLPI